MLELKQVILAHACIFLFFLILCLYYYKYGFSIFIFSTEHDNKQPKTATWMCLKYEISKNKSQCPVK